MKIKFEYFDTVKELRWGIMTSFVPNNHTL